MPCALGIIGLMGKTFGLLGSQDFIPTIHRLNNHKTNGRNRLTEYFGFMELRRIDEIRRLPGRLELDDGRYERMVR